MDSLEVIALLSDLKRNITEDAGSGPGQDNLFAYYWMPEWKKLKKRINEVEKWIKETTQLER